MVMKPFLTRKWLKPVILASLNKFFSTRMILFFGTVFALYFSKKKKKIKRVNGLKLKCTQNIKYILLMHLKPVQNVNVQHRLENWKQNNGKCTAAVARLVKGTEAFYRPIITNTYQNKVKGHAQFAPWTLPTWAPTMYASTVRNGVSLRETKCTLLPFYVVMVYECNPNIFAVTHKLHKGLSTSF